MKTTHTSGQLVRFLTMLDEQGVTVEIFQSRLCDGTLVDLFDPNAKVDRARLREALGLPALPINLGTGRDAIALATFGVLEVNYSEPYRSILLGACDGDHMDPNVAQRLFPLELVGRVRLEVALMHFRFSAIRPIEDIARRARCIDKENPWQVAGIGSLCAFGQKYPDEQRRYPIVALGSVGEASGLCSPMLDTNHASRRELRLCSPQGLNDQRNRFLVVRRA
jgi:hypothetical protein